MGNQVFELAILLSLRDAASGKLNRTEAQLRSLGKESKHTLQTFEDLRRGLGRDLAIGGIGIGGLMLLKGGVMIAADYESALLDLKSAYQEVASAGGLSAAEQASQLNQLEHLAVKLGNRLQGNTGDYVGVLASLRKAGIDTETVLGGAGEAAANLANVSGALMRGMATEQAKELGQFGKMFKLKPDEFEKSVNLFSALKDRFDVESGSLIESAKYFQATSNQLKISGIGGAEETLKLFALLKRQGGLEGSMAGTGARSFFTNVITEKKKIAALKSETGIDLSGMFDVKGEFKGFENALSIMEKFRKLTPQKRVEKLNDIFGERGGEVASVMVESGVEGWRAINAETAKAVPVSEKINQQMETTRAKLEAIKGSATNLVATAFTPMLGTLKPILDLTNNVVGGLQELGATYPQIANVGLRLFGVGSAALVVYSGVGMMTKGWRLWRTVSTIGASEQSLLTFLRKTRTEAAATGTALETAGTKAGRLKGAVSGIGSIATALGVAIAIDQLIQLKSEIDNRAKEIEDLKNKSSELYRLYFPEKWKLIQDMGGVPSVENESGLRAFNAKEAVDVGEKFNVNQQLELSLDSLKWDNVIKNLRLRETPFMGEGHINSKTDKLFDALGLPRALSSWPNPASALPVLGNRYDPKVAGGKLFELDHRLLIPDVMKEFIRGLDKGTVLSSVSREGRERVKQTLAESPQFGDTYRKATADLQAEALMLRGQIAPVGEGLNLLNLALNPLPTSIDTTTEKFNKIIPPIDKFPSLITNAGIAAQSFADRANSAIFNGQPLPGTTGGTTDTTTTGKPSSLINRIVGPIGKSPDTKKSHASPVSLVMPSLKDPFGVPPALINDQRLNTSLASLREPKYQEPRLRQPSERAMSNSMGARGDSFNFDIDFNTTARESTSRRREKIDIVMRWQRELAERLRRVEEGQDERNLGERLSRWANREDARS